MNIAIISQNQTGCLQEAAPQHDVTRSVAGYHVEMDHEQG